MISLHGLLIFPQLHVITIMFFFSQNVIDGDLCEQFNMVDSAKQRSIAEDLDKTPNELSKRLEDIRTRYAF